MVLATVVSWASAERVTPEKYQNGGTAQQAATLRRDFACWTSQSSALVAVLQPASHDLVVSAVRLTAAASVASAPRHKESVNAKHLRRLPTASRSYAAFGFQAIFSLFLLAAQSRKYMLINVW